MSRHKWGEPVRPDLHNTFRTCSKCGLVKITRHEPDNFPVEHWIEWELDGQKIDSKFTPPCEEAMPKETKAAEPAHVYRLIELRAENFKILKAVSVRPNGSVLKVSGRNEQGKSSLLDAVAAAIGGKDAFPAEPIRKGEDRAEIYLDFGGLKLTRKIWHKEGGGVGHSVVLEYADGSRPKSPQDVLKALRGSPIADDPIEFSRLKPKERYDLLKKLVPKFDFEEQAKARAELFEERTGTGRLLERAKGAAASIEVPADAHDRMVDVTELAAELRAAGDHNALVDKRAEGRSQMAEKVETLRDDADALIARAKAMNAEAEELQKKLDGAEKLPAKISTADIEQKIANAETINAGARALADRRAKEAEAKAMEQQYEDLSDGIAEIDNAKKAAIEKAKLPIKELSFGDDDILLDGLPFDQASTARKIRVSTALLMAMKPELRVLLVREGSLLDEDARAALEADAKANGFVVLMECVGAGDGSGIVIEDGEIV
jgi:hypothetical protein